MSLKMFWHKALPDQVQRCPVQFSIGHGKKNWTETRNPCMFGVFFGRRFGCLLSSFFQAKECPSITSHAAFEKGCLGENLKRLDD